MKTGAGDEENSVQQSDYNPLAETFNYGNSFNQINQIKVNLVHNQGIFGQGVMIASFDNGWRNQTHEAFTTLPMKVVSQYDFQLGRPGANNIGATTSHGTQTLSNVGGYMPGKLIAPSFRSAFIVARTEVDSFERPIEMDNWMAATEWADSLGADVITSSVGYLGFDAVYTSYTWTDMNGNNLLVTRAADLAVNKGSIICNSAGNLFIGTLAFGESPLAAPTRFGVLIGSAISALCGLALLAAVLPKRSPDEA